MKIIYAFANETIEIEVDDQWGNTLIELNRQEYNLNHKETRRHSSLDGMDYEGDIFADDFDIIKNYIISENVEELNRAIKVLLPRQQELINKVFFQKRNYSDVAREYGLDESAIRHAINRALKKLKFILK